MTCYDEYIMKPKEKALYITLSAIVISIICYIFYRSLITALIFCPLAFLYPKIKTRQIIEKRKMELLLQFKEALYSLSASLSAGKSIELAFSDAIKDLKIMYQQADIDIINEFEYIIHKLSMNIPIEDALDNLAKRSGLEDIQNFTDVFITCKKSGGNLIYVMKNTSDIINDKIDIKQDINLLISQRKLEQKILNILPIFLIILLSFCAPDFMEPVFTTLMGNLAMTVAVAMFATAYFLSHKIMDIKI